MNQRGQMTVEAILITVVLLAITISFTRFARNNGLVAEVVEGPWQPIRGMIENGVWASGEKARLQHPSQKSRHSSNEGDVIPAN